MIDFDAIIAQSASGQVAAYAEFLKDRDEQLMNLFARPDSIHQAPEPIQTPLLRVIFPRAVDVVQDEPGHEIGFQSQTLNRIR